MLLRALIAASAFTLPMVASATVVIHTSPFITTPIASTDFEAVGPSQLAINTPYSLGGVTIEYVWPTAPDPSAATAGPDWHIWYAIDYKGYTSIRLDSGASFNQIQFDAASGFGSGSVQYDLRYLGSEVATGAIGSLGANSAFPYATYGFSGILFDEVRLRSDHNLSTYQDGGSSDALALDNVVLGRASVAAVPEPSVWLMLVAGFGLIGAMLRHKGANQRGQSWSTTPLVRVG